MQNTSFGAAVPRRTLRDLLIFIIDKLLPFCVADFDHQSDTDSKSEQRSIRLAQNMIAAHVSLVHGDNILGVPNAVVVDAFRSSR